MLHELNRLNRERWLEHTKLNQKASTKVELSRERKTASKIREELHALKMGMQDLEGKFTSELKRFVKKTDPSRSARREDVQALSMRLSELETSLEGLETRVNTSIKQGFKAQNQNALQDKAEALASKSSACQTAALNGEYNLVNALTSAVDITAVDLNAAAAGELKRDFLVLLQDDSNNNHVWAGFAPVLTASKGDVADGDVSDPTITGTPNFVEGTLAVELTFDTDAGATRTYIAAETMTLVVQVAADDTHGGHPVTQLSIDINVT